MKDVLEEIAVGTILIYGVKCRCFVNSDGGVLVLCGRCRVSSLLISFILMSVDDVLMRGELMSGALINLRLKSFA